MPSCIKSHLFCAFVTIGLLLTLFQLRAIAGAPGGNLIFYVEATSRSAAKSGLITDIITKAQNQNPGKNVIIKYLFNNEYEKGKYKASVRTCYQGHRLEKEKIKRIIESLKSKSGAKEGLHTYVGLFKALVEDSGIGKNEVVAIYSFLCPDEGSFNKQLNYSKWSMKLDLHKIRNSPTTRIHTINFKRLGVTEVNLAEHFDLRTKHERFSPRREVSRKTEKKAPQKPEQKAKPNPEEKPAQQTSPVQKTEPDTPDTSKPGSIDQNFKKTDEDGQTEQRQHSENNKESESSKEKSTQPDCYPLTIQNIDKKDWHFGMKAEICNDKRIYAYYEPRITPSINLKIELQPYSKDINVKDYDDYFVIKGSKIIGEKFKRVEFRAAGKAKANTRTGRIVFREDKHE